MTSGDRAETTRPAQADAAGVPITVERIYADMVKAGRFDLAADLVVSQFESRKR